MKFGGGRQSWDAPASHKFLFFFLTVHLRISYKGSVLTSLVREVGANGCWRYVWRGI